MKIDVTPVVTLFQFIIRRNKGKFREITRKLGIRMIRKILRNV